jgi:hypothetical protein
VSAAKLFHIPEPRLERQGDVWRVTADIEGTTVFFESRTPLSPRPEVFVCPFLLPAMAQHADLEVASPLSPRFLENLEFVRQRAMEWWPSLSDGAIRSPRGAARERRGSHEGAFFTGGADSTYVLQQLHPRLRYAVFNEGFDIPLIDVHAERLRQTGASLGASAAACGLELLVVRTNLRKHPLFQAPRWGTTHVAALAGVAHALGDHVHTMYVAASDVPPPWGSYPDLDAAWSSEAVEIRNFSAELSRLQRVESIAKWEPARGRLRVCLTNYSPLPELNCGHCEKCLRTRLQLLIAGAPDGLDSFRAEVLPLRSELGSLSWVPTDCYGQWREIEARLGDRGITREIERAIRGERQPVWRRGARHLRRIALRSLRRLRSARGAPADAR